MADPKTLLDAVSSAVEAPKDEAPPEPKEDVELDETPADDKLADDKPADETPADDKPADDKPADEKPADDKPADEKPADDKPPVEKPVDEKPPVEKKPVDPVNDPIPPTVSERTRERITSLVSTVKQQAPIIEQHNELMATIAETGVTPDNFANTLQVLRLYNSPNIEDKRKAYQYMVKEVEFLATQIGETPPGKDPLEGHQDLAESVAAAQLTPQHAAEIARARNAEKLQKEQQSRSIQEQNEYAQAHAQAKKDLNALEETIRGIDPGYDTKRAALIAHCQPILAKLHPSQWVARFQKELKEFKPKAAPAVPPVAPTPGGGPQPLRANKQPSGGGKKTATSLLEAVSASLESPQ